jgi:signal transduction histidine kinase
MSGLPEIVRGSVRYRLPLTPEAATCLAGALLANDQADRLHWLMRGLTHDPPLALWCALQGPELDGDRPVVAVLCEWLAGRLTRDFAQPQPADAPVAASARQALRVQELLIRSRAVAQKASESSGPDADARLIGLLHRAVDWLVLACTPRPTVKAAADLLPRWLATSLARLKKLADCPAGSIEAHVRLAIHNSKTAAERSASSQTVSAGSNALAQFIPKLAEQAARIERLAADFDQAVEQAKLEALKEFAYGAGHEINNPLANISARAQTLLKDERDPERRQKLAAINTQAFRAHEMIADLMLFARPPEMKPERIELAPFLTELARTWQEQAGGQQTEIELSVLPENLNGNSSSATLAVWADANALAVALRALVTNALEALGRGGRVEVVARPALASRGDSLAGQGCSAAVEISVCDNGPGISAEIRARLFDPYFSGREAGRGLGFGLCKCWRIVTAQAGRIEVASDVGAGATFTITLPSAAGSRQG